MAKPPESHPEFGKFICARGHSALYWLVGVILSVCGIVAVVGSGASLLQLLPAPKGAKTDIGMTLIMAAIGAGVLWAGIASIQLSRVRLFFFEHGLVRRRGRKDLLVAYQSAISLRYHVTRRFVNGVYAGTTMDFELIDDEGRRIRYSGSHKERAAGLFTILTKKFEGSDEMDGVRGVIAGTIADRLQGYLLDGATLEWGRDATLCADGLTPRKGKAKGRLIPWAQLDRMKADNGAFYLFRRGEDRSCVGVALSAQNSWPTLEVALRMIRANAPANPTEVAA